MAQAAGGGGKPAVLLRRSNSSTSTDGSLTLDNKASRDWVLWVFYAWQARLGASLTDCSRPQEASMAVQQHPARRTDPSACMRKTGYSSTHSRCQALARRDQRS